MNKFSSADVKLRDNRPNKPEEKIVMEDMPSSGKIVTPNMKMFTLAELRAATKNFRPDTILGEGGFGRVFKGWVDEKTYAPSKVGVGMAVAVKKSNPDSLQGLQEWQVSFVDLRYTKIGNRSINGAIFFKVSAFSVHEIAIFFK